MKNQTYRMTMLLDFYGEILTQRQREFFDLYYNEDLSLAEIAENYGISRQGVRDAIVRAETAMEELEDKTGLLKRFMRLRERSTPLKLRQRRFKSSTTGSTIIRSWSVWRGKSAPAPPH